MNEPTLDQKKIENLLKRVENMECQLLAHRAHIASLTVAMDAMSEAKYAKVFATIFDDVKIIAATIPAASFRDPKAIAADRLNYLAAEQIALSQAVLDFRR